MDLNKLLSYSVDSGASDLHLSVGSIPMVRINGTMQPLNMDPIKQEDIESILPQILDEDQLQSFEKNKEIDFSASLEGKGRFRVNFFNQIKGMAGVFRTIPEVVKDFDDLGIPPVLKSLALLDRGLVLLTGPTGSGKSTTLAAMVDHINTQRKCHIITIEDPVEYYHETKESLINQRELGANTHSFSNAMRSALREDPKFQRLGEGKKRRRLLKEAIAKDYEEQQRRSPEQLERIAEYERSKETFVIPNGMTAEEATREMIRKESEIYGEGGSAKRIVRDLSYPIGRNTGDPFDNMSDYQRSSYLQYGKSSSL